MRTFNEDHSSFFIDQSAHDVPCRVRFAGNDALMSLSRWGGEASLAFAPGDTHLGETRIRGNEILLKSEATPKCYHVFRRLDGERFEYDVVLLKEPETNVIEIELDFPEGLEFYRQPSMDALIRSPYRCAPEVEESYAVYWKERNGPYKTGKFCHIYRPEIRDARGRKVWGRLDIVGHTMTITIPEGWLSDAAYPVVVDPIVGTQTRGALNTIDWYNEDNPTTFYLEIKMGFSRFVAATPISGQCTSYIYSYYNEADTAQAVLFSDSSGAPYARLSRDEQIVQLQRSTPAWVASTFNLPQTVAQGAAFWYGYYTQEMLYTYYDAVGTFRRMSVDDYPTVPDVYNPQWNPETWQVLMSAYFSYSIAQSLSRSVMDTIGLTESFGRQFALKRSCANGVAAVGEPEASGFHPRLCSDSFQGTVIINRITSFFRVLLDALECKRASSRIVMIYRALSETIGFSDILERVRGLVRTCTSGFAIQDETYRLFEYRRLLDDEVDTAGAFSMIQTLIRFCASGLSGIGSLIRSVGLFRSITSLVTFLERLLPRMILKKEELIIVSRVTREIEFKGDLI
ncbi:MAG TPA: hypothetical protein PLU93_08720 [Treponemataceae bacterium]|nr:hypothetical protein [Treponemataceae bacterium]